MKKDRTVSEPQRRVNIERTHAYRILSQRFSEPFAKWLSLHSYYSYITLTLNIISINFI
jgi:hypothetical protein